MLLSLRVGHSEGNDPMVKRPLSGLLLALVAALSLAPQSALAVRASLDRLGERAHEKVRGHDDGPGGAAGAKEARAAHAVFKSLGPGGKPATPAQIARDFVAVKQVIHQVRIVPLMKELALGHTVTVGRVSVDFDKLKDLWTDKTDSNWVEGEFRDARPNNHEWIPSNYMVKVIERAQGSREGLAWIDLQDQMRSLTHTLIFNPKRAQITETLHGKKYLVPQGHTGALEDRSTGAPLTAGQADFHDQLRDVFERNKSLAGCVAGIKQVVKEWVWDGSDPGLPISPKVRYHGGKALAAIPDLRKQQAANYRAIQSMLDGVIAQVKSVPPPDAHDAVAADPGHRSSPARAGKDLKAVALLAEGHR